MGNLIGGISRVSENMALTPSPSWEPVSSIDFKLNGLVNLFNPSKELLQIPLSGQLANNVSKAGVVVCSLFQMRSETKPISKSSEGNTAFLVELFDASELGKESEEEIAFSEEEVETLESEAIEEEMEKEEGLEDDDEELDGLEMQESGFDEGSSFSMMEEDSSDAIPDVLLKEVWDNAKNVILNGWKLNQKVYASLVEGFMSFSQLCQPFASSFFSIEHEIGSNAGLQSMMKEASFFQECEEGVLLGVFGGSRHALSYAKQAFQGKFPEKNGAEAFQSFVCSVKEEIIQNQLWSIQGSSALLCFIEKKTGRIYTAGWGNGEVYICRKVGEKRKLIPLFYKEKEKTSITVNLLKVDDTLLVMSEGCDYCFSEKEVLLKVETLEKDESLAVSFLNDAVYAKRSRENVSIITVKVSSL